MLRPGIIHIDSRGARVCGHTTTAMHGVSTTPPISLPKPKLHFLALTSIKMQFTLLPLQQQKTSDGPFPLTRGTFSRFMYDLFRARKACILTGRSIRWHRQRRRVANGESTASSPTRTTAPPAPVPSVPMSAGDWPSTRWNSDQSPERTASRRRTAAATWQEKAQYERV